MGLSAIESGWVTFSAPNDKNMSLADPHLTLECKTVHIEKHVKSAVCHQSVVMDSWLIEKSC